MSGGFFRGTTIDQDQRFGDGSKQMMKQATFSRLLKKPVDMKRVNMEAIKPWISDKIFELLEIEDDVLFEYVVNLLEESDKPDPRAMQVNLTGFLEQKAPEFMHSLWAVLLEAQKGEGGIPESFIRKKMEELKRKREDEERAAERIRESSSRGREQSVQRRDHSGRQSRWDTRSDDRTSKSRSYRDSRDNSDRRQHRRRSRSRSPSKRRHPSLSPRRS